MSTANSWQRPANTHPLFHLPAVIADPKDQPIIEAAIAARVDVICASDVHFEARLVRNYLAGFGVAVMTDRELLAALR